MLKLYGHPFSSYTWKALIPIYANEAPFGFEELPVDGQGPAWDFVREASPLGKFPVLSDAGHIVFEATAIIEHLAVHRLPDAGLIPADPQKAVETRKMDRVFDNYVMNLMQEGAARGGARGRRGHSPVLNAVKVRVISRRISLFSESGGTMRAMSSAASMSSASITLRQSSRP